MTYLESLAVRFVERDGLSVEEQDKIISDAVDYIQTGYRNQRAGSESPALQLAKSIHQWHSLAGDDDDAASVAGESIEKKARAHKFMASILKSLPKTVLKPREVNLFTTFFCSMYQLQDASLSATTEALASLIWMDNFDPSAAADILSNIGHMEPENFTKQLAKTRLEIFNLIDTLFNGPPGRALQERQDQYEYLLKVLPLVGRERDPLNLLQWFHFLDRALKNTKLSTEAADAMFDCFSPFFPISIRRSTAIGPEVTEEQLKEALNSCFAANGMLAHRALPFLLGKLDGGASLTAAAKLDILRTINGCVKSYEPVDNCVLPHVVSIWSSLKYEVRHGEIPEAIQETLSVFRSVSERLVSSPLTTHLKSFVDKIWDDCAEDLENPTYTEQAGSILISVAQAHLKAFCLICPRVLDDVRRIITQPKSPAHTKSLLIVLNNLLRARRSVLPPLPIESPSDIYQDDSVTVTRGIYFKLFKENAVENPSPEQVEISKQTLQGLAQIVKQRRPFDDGKSYVTDCDEDAFKEICGTLTHRVVNCFNIKPPSSQGDKDIEEAAIEALRTTVTFYPVGYGKIVSNVVDEVVKRNWTNNPTDRTYEALSACCDRLASVGCLSLPEDSAPLVNFAAFTGGMLKILGILFSTKADFKACAFVASSLSTGLMNFVQYPLVQGPILKAGASMGEPGPSPQETVPWSLTHIKAAIKDTLPSFPDLTEGRVDQFDPSQVIPLMSDGYVWNEKDFVISLLQFGVYIVAQLYQHATKQTQTSEGIQLGLCEYLTISSGGPEDSQAESTTINTCWRDRYLGQVGKIATTILLELETPAQKGLMLDEQILACFHTTKLDGQLRFWSHHSHGIISELSVGIARAIQPALVLNMYSDIRDVLIGDFDTSTKLSDRARDARECIAMLLANKYNTRARVAEHIMGQTHDTWIRVLAEIRQVLSDSSMMADIPEDKFRRMVCILVGAMARGDRYIDRDLEDAVSHAAVKGGPHRGKLMARFLSNIVTEPSNPGYLIRNPIHRQRTYNRCVHPVLKDAYPLQPEGSDSVTYAVYVLHAVKQLTLDQYEEDVDKVIRIALAAMQKAVHIHDVDAACSIILHILKREPSLLQDHVSSIVAASKYVYLNAAQKVVATSIPADTATDPWKPVYANEDGRFIVRKKTIRLLKALPQQIDERFVRPEANVVLAFLLEVLADKAREVRQLAQPARNAWLRIAE